MSNSDPYAPYKRNSDGSFTDCRGTVFTTYGGAAPTAGCEVNVIGNGTSSRGQFQGEVIKKQD